MEHHEIADVFPMFPASAMSDLVDDIVANGLRHPVVLFEGKILDGRNRFKACQLAGILPETVKFAGDWAAAVKLVTSENLQRRHLSNPQRAFAADKLALLAKGRPAENAPRGAFTQTQAAELMGTSRRSVQRVRQVREQGVPELVTAVEQEMVPLGAAAELAALPEEEQRAALARGPRAVRETIKAARAQPPQGLSPTQQAIRRKARTDNLFHDLVKLMTEVKSLTAQFAEGDLAITPAQRDIGTQLAEQFITVGQWLTTLFKSEQGVSDAALISWLSEGKDK